MSANDRPGGLLILLLAVGCAGPAGLRGGSARGQLQEENRKLRAELGKQQEAATRAHASASQAEVQAQVAHLSCAAVAPAGGGGVRSGEVYGQVELNGAFFLRPRFNPPRDEQGLQHSTASCEVGR